MNRQLQRREPGPTQLLERSDAMLMGRWPYDGFAPVWSARSGDPVSDA